MWLLFSYLCASPMEVLFAIYNIESIVRGFEIFFCKLRDLFRLIQSAAEHIQVDCTACICKMPRDQRGLDQLSHAEAGHTRIITEEHDLCLAVAAHLNTVTQNTHELTDSLCILHQTQITRIQVDTGGNTPVLIGTAH